jgi:hypothetical protein
MCIYFLVFGTRKYLRTLPNHLSHRCSNRLEDYKEGACDENKQLRNIPDYSVYLEHDSTEYNISITFV